MRSVGLYGPSAQDSRLESKIREGLAQHVLLFLKNGLLVGQGSGELPDREGAEPLIVMHY